MTDAGGDFVGGGGAPLDRSDRAKNITAPCATPGCADRPDMLRSDRLPLQLWGTSGPSESTTVVAMLVASWVAMPTLSERPPGRS